ncbi:ICP0-binding domain of ubiquitin-specific protease 7-domain-containing protein [Rhizophagus diaphanus]|nr:ICP0-binding domain of ubiquitin-specific protease 7-domain-containing protein [Rhizophagus diaphanus] [Rhizophagus sp. MUCL 43196]
MKHLYLTIKIVTTEKFDKHQGFDLVNFDHQFLFYDVYTFKILKAETYSVFKENISRTFNVPSKQVRFWVFVYRQNKTIRPDHPIPESYMNISMEGIRDEIVPRQNELKLYMEVADKPINDETWFPLIEENKNIIVFLKYFDPDTQTLEGLGHLYVQEFDKVGDYINVFCKRKNLPPDTPLKIYEEIKPSMIEEMNPNFTIKQSEIQNGDIICFQKASNMKIREHIKSIRIFEIPKFYKLLSTFTVKVVTVEKFKKYQGFDLANFENTPLSDIYLYKILMNTTYGVFKENVSQYFNIPSEQVRFWILVNRQNGTVRPDVPIPESYSNTSMKEIHARLISQEDEMKLYMEVADKKFNGKTLLSSIKENISILIFLKYFDPDTQTLEGLGHLYVRRFDKSSNYIHTLCKKKNFPLDTPLKLYEEIKPNMIDEIDLRFTFQRLELQNGDIICFQKNLTEKEIQEHIEAGRIHSIPQFYESLSLHTVFSFKSRLKNYPKFNLILNKKLTYNQACIVAEAVAFHLNIDLLKIRFEKPYGPIEQTANRALLDMIRKPKVYYEILDGDFIEPEKPEDTEKEKFFKIIWLGNTIKNEEIIDIRLQKDAIVSEIIKEILKKVTLSSPDAKIRLYEVMNHKIQKEYKETELTGRIQEFMTLYAEEIPQDELLANSNDQIIQVYHFIKDPIQTHGIPFKFVIKNGETLTDIKIRLQLRLGMNKIEFSRIKIAIISEITYEKPEYLEDDDIILSERELSNTDYLGLDHVDETESAEKIIYIRG